MSEHNLLPPNATAGEIAMERATSRIGRVDLSPITQLWNPNTCPANLLPWLAWALNVNPWDPTWSVAQQRAAIASSVQVHRVRGTIGALKTAIAAVGYNATITEYPGTFTFSVSLDASASGIGTAAPYQNALAIANLVKNARSKLVNIAVTLTTPPAGPVYGAAVSTGRVVSTALAA